MSFEAAQPFRFSSQSKSVLGSKFPGYCGNNGAGRSDWLTAWPPTIMTTPIEATAMETVTMVAVQSERRQPCRSGEFPSLVS